MGFIGSNGLLYVKPKKLVAWALEILNNLIMLWWLNNVGDFSPMQILLWGRCIVEGIFLMVIF